MDDQERQEIKHDRYRLEQLLIEDGVKAIPERGKFLCPYHPDRNPSSEIKETPGGFYFICYACDLHLDYFALQAFRQNIPLKEAFKQASSSLDNAAAYLFGAATPQQTSTHATVDDLVNQYLSRHPNTTLEEINRYDDPDTGGCVFATVRFQIPGRGKAVFQAMFTYETGWDFKSPKENLPLYNLTRVRQSDNVLVVEGEKCVNRFTQLNIEGWAATTSPGGSKKAQLANWEPLRGKRVVIWRDADTPGKRYQDDIIGFLQKLETPVRVINVDRVPDWSPQQGEDIVDYLVTVPPAEEALRVTELIEAAPLWTPSTDYDTFMVDVIEGRYQLVELPGFPVLSRLTQMALPGKSALVIGRPGSAKSFLVMQVGWQLNETQVPTATLFLEDGKTDYQTRCIAQMTGRSEYTSGIWQTQNHTEFRQLFESVRCRIDGYFQHVTCLEAKMMTPANVLDWLLDVAKRGYRVAIIDPATAMEMAAKQWSSDQNFVLAAQSIITDYGMSLIATTHQKAGMKKADIDGAAGGQAWSRFTHTNIWLEQKPDLKPFMSRVEQADRQQNVIEHQRTLLITKARNGAGTWRSVAVDLDPTTLRFIEHGVVLGKAELTPVIQDVEQAPF